MGAADWSWVPDSQGMGGHWQEPVVKGSSSDPANNNPNFSGYYNQGNTNADAVQNAQIHSMGDQLLARDKLINSRQAPTLADNTTEFNQTNDSRNLQLGALAQQQQAAMGLGPSLAKVQNQQAMGQGFQGLGAGMGGAGGNLLAQRQAQMGGNAGLGQTAAQGATARGGEIYNAMGAYGQGAAGLRTSDLGAQQAAMQQIAAQRGMQLNQARSNTTNLEGYEGLDLATAQNYSKLAQDAHARNVAQGMDTQKQTAGDIGTTASVVATLGSLALLMA